MGVWDWTNGLRTVYLPLSRSKETEQVRARGSAFGKPLVPGWGQSEDADAIILKV